MSPGWTHLYLAASQFREPTDVLTVAATSAQRYWASFPASCALPRHRSERLLRVLLSRRGVAAVATESSKPTSTVGAAAAGPERADSLQSFANPATTTEKTLVIKYGIFDVKCMSSTKTRVETKAHLS